MRKELELWNFVAERLRLGESVMLLVVAESSGSSPGRAGYKMAVGMDDELIGSIGGGVMEVRLVEGARQILLEAADPTSAILSQEHRKTSDHPSGMICSGEQTVIQKRLMPSDLTAIEGASDDALMTITADSFSITPSNDDSQTISIDFEVLPNLDFVYRERLGPKNSLIIIGGGHCGLALSELMSRMDFQIHIFDDRPDLNTIEKNEFADEITIIDNYDTIDEAIAGDASYVVVMTIGYATDAIVIRELAMREFKYFGVLGSKAKMATLIRELQAEGVNPDRLARIRTPIGLPINSHTPEEIAVSIAAEMILVKNTSS